MNPVYRDLQCRWMTRNCVFAILTALKDYKTKAEDNADNRELRSLVRSTNFGYRKVTGKYKEDYKVNGKPTGIFVDHIDNSVIVLAGKTEETRLLNFSKLMMKRYDQDSILFKHANGTVELVYPDHTEKLGKFHANKLADYMSTFKDGKSFSFDLVTSQTLMGENSGMYTQMALNHRMKELELGSTEYLTFTNSRLLDQQEDIL